MKAIYFLGQELNIGDTVVYTDLYYRNLTKGIIQRITEKTLFIECISKGRDIKQSHSQVIKIKL